MHACTYVPRCACVRVSICVRREVCSTVCTYVDTIFTVLAANVSIKSYKIFDGLKCLVVDHVWCTYITVTVFVCICLYVCLYIRLCIQCMHAGLCLCHKVIASVSQSVSQSVCLSVCLSLCACVCVCVHLHPLSPRSLFLMLSFGCCPARHVWHTNASLRTS